MGIQLRTSLLAGLVFLIGIVASLSWPRTVSAGTASLGEILHAVEQNAPAIKAADANEDAARAKRRQVIGSFLGEVDVYANDQHFNDNRLTRPISPPIALPALTFDKDQIGYGVGARLPIDISGRLRNNLHAVSHQANAAHADAEDAQLNILYAAASLYRRLDDIHGQRAALLKQEEALRGHVDVAQEAVRVGRIAHVEELRLIAELKAVEGRLAGLDGLESGVRARLASLLNVPSFSDSIPECSVTPDSIPECSVTPDSMSVISHSIDDRPDIQAALERERSAHSAVKAAWGRYIPEVSVTAGWQQNQGYNGAGKDDATWQVAIQARLPLWNGGQRLAQLSQAKAQQRTAMYHAETERQNAVAEVVAARGAWEAAQAQYRAAQSALSAAEEVARIQADRFNNDRLSAADLVDADAALARARAERTSSLARWWQADDALRLSVGLPPAAYNDETTVSE